MKVNAYFGIIEMYNIEDGDNFQRVCQQAINISNLEKTYPSTVSLE